MEIKHLEIMMMVLDFYPPWNKEIGRPFGNGSKTSIESNEKNHVD